MSGGLSFITTNPGSEGFERTDNAIARQRQREWQDQDRREARDVDRAIRGGLSEISAGGFAATTPRSSGGSNPPVQANDRDAFRTSLASIEDPTGAAINPSGHIGRYQFSTGALHGAGAYEPAPGENLRANQWKGAIVLPGGRRMTRDQFLADPQAQEDAFTAHVGNLDREIAARGLDRYVGTRVMDQPITRSALYAMMHMGGPEGTARFLRSGGVYDPADANGMRISTYSQEVLKRMGLGGVGGRYDPVISRLANVPGGGRAALDLVGRNAAEAEREQARGDRRFESDRSFQQRQTETEQARNDRFQMMAMQAFARGDADVGRYWAEQGKFKIPEQLANNPEAMARFGKAATMARSVYGEDRAGASRFVREFMTNGGDAAAALEKAGDPTNVGAGTLTWRDDGNGRSVGGMVDRRTGVFRPITDIDGNPVYRAPSQGQQAREADRAVRLRMLRTAGFSEQDANAIAAGAVPTPNAMVTAYGRIAKIAAEDFSLKDDAARQSAIERAMGTMFGPEWRDRMRGAPPAQATPSPLPAPAATPGQAAPPAVRPVIQKQRPPNVPAGSQWNEQRQLWRDPSGRIYDQNGVAR
jgi:hypothetical protein